MEIKKYLKPYIECTKVETECALLAGGSGGAGGGGLTPGPGGSGGGGHAKTKVHPTFRVIRQSCSA